MPTTFVLPLQRALEALGFLPEKGVAWAKLGERSASNDCAGVGANDGAGANIVDLEELHEARGW